MRNIDKSHVRALVALAIAVGVHAVFCLSLHYHFLNPLFHVTAHAKGQAGPFFGIYQAGVNLRGGESIYATEGYSPPSNVVVPYYHFYRYLPFVSYVAAVVSKVLEPWPAYWLWVVVNEILLGVCILMTFRLRRLFGAAAIAAAAFWLLYSPMYIELYMGQFCFTMAFCIFLMLYPCIGRRTPAPADSDALGAPAPAGNPGGPVPAGPDSARTATTERSERASPFGRLASLSWVLSLLVKSFTVLYVPTLYRIGKRKLAVAGLALAVLTSAPYFILRSGDIGWFLRLNLQPLPPRLTGGCFGFAGFLRDICNNALPAASAAMVNLGPIDVAPRNVPLFIVAASIVLTTLYLTLRRKRIDPLAGISLWTLTFFLVFKDIWEYHYVMLIPLFVAYYLETRSKFVLVLFVLLAVPTPFFLYDVPASDDPQRFWSAPLSLAHHSFKALPTFLFYLWVVKRELGGIMPRRAAGPLEA